LDGPSGNPTICGDPLRAYGPSLGLRRPTLLRPRRPAPNPRPFPGLQGGPRTHAPGRPGVGKTGPKVGPEKSKGLGNPQETLVPDPRALGLKVGDCSDEAVSSETTCGEPSEGQGLDFSACYKPGHGGSWRNPRPRACLGGCPVGPPPHRSGGLPRQPTSPDLDPPSGAKVS